MSNDRGFSKIRNGINKHIKEGKFQPSDLGVYLWLHLNCNWKTGVCETTAQGIAYGFNDAKLTESIQKSLRRLRTYEYINYRKGTGQRGKYKIIIHKFEPSGTEGVRVNAFYFNDKIEPFLERWNSSDTEEEPVEEQLSCGSDTGRDMEEAPVETPIPDITDIPDVPDTPNVPDFPDIPSEEKEEESDGGDTATVALPVPDVKKRQTATDPSLGEKLADKFWKLLGSPFDYNNDVTRASWKKAANRMITAHGGDYDAAKYVYRVMKFGVKEEPFWANILNSVDNKDPLLYFEQKFDKIAKKLEATKISAAAQAAKDGKVKDAGKAQYIQDSGKQNYLVDDKSWRKSTPKDGETK